MVGGDSRLSCGGAIDPAWEDGPLNEDWAGATVWAVEAG
jgi:hypothetical protein